MWHYIFWVVLILAVWIAVAAFIGLIVGRTIHRRDKQVALDEHQDRYGSSPKIQSLDESER